MTTMHLKQCPRCTRELTFDVDGPEQFEEVLRNEGWQRIFGRWYCWKCSPAIVSRIELWGIVIASIVGAVLGIIHWR